MWALEVGAGKSDAAKSAGRQAVSLLELAVRLPALLFDTPVILRGALTGLLALPISKTSIGKVFQDRAGHYPERVFLRFGDEEITYREANETVNRYAAVLAGYGVGHGDVVGIMLRNRPETVLAMLAAVKCGAVAGMLNYNQRVGCAGAQPRSAELHRSDRRSRSAQADSRQRRQAGQARHHRRGRQAVSRASPPAIPRRRRRSAPGTPRSTSSPRAPPATPRPA